MTPDSQAQSINLHVGGCSWLYILYLLCIDFLFLCLTMCLFHTIYQWIRGRRIIHDGNYLFFDGLNQRGSDFSRGFVVHL